MHAPVSGVLCLLSIYHSVTSIPCGSKALLYSVAVTNWHSRQSAKTKKENVKIKIQKFSQLVCNW